MTLMVHHIFSLLSQKNVINIFVGAPPPSPRLWRAGTLHHMRAGTGACPYSYPPIWMYHLMSFAIILLFRLHLKPGLDFLCCFNLFLFYKNRQTRTTLTAAEIWHHKHVYRQTRGLF
jgi:hypothetical protein